MVNPGRLLLMATCMMGLLLLLPVSKTMAQVNPASTVPTMNTQPTTSDQETLSRLNARFIQNFLTQDVAAHSQLIHPDFVCIESSGAIVTREQYLRAWATDFENSGYETFTYTDESIRIFGDIAFVRAKTTYTKTVDGRKETGQTIYTDTYYKEQGTWRCVQVQITPVKQ